MKMPYWAALVLLPYLHMAGAADIELPEISLVDEAVVAEMPVPRVGSFQEFVGRVGSVDCQRWEVSATNEMGYLVSHCKGFQSLLSVAGGYNLTKMVGPDGQPLVIFEPYYPAVQFPLALNKTWDADYTGFLAVAGLRWTGHLKCTVAEYAPVKVAAGTLDAFRIECYDHQKAGMLETGANTTVWYAPQVPGVVKSINRVDSRWDSELQDYGPR